MTEDSREIIGLLRDARLGWIADEIVDDIALGRQVEQQFREEGANKRSVGSRIEPYSADEERRLIVETLYQYLIVLPRAWDEASKLFSAEDTFTTIEPDDELVAWGLRSERPTMSLGIAGDEGRRFVPISTEQFFGTTVRLQKVLRHLWPDGIDAFDLKLASDQVKRP